MESENIDLPQNEMYQDDISDNLDDCQENGQGITEEIIDDGVNLQPSELQLNDIQSSLKKVKLNKKDLAADFGQMVQPDFSDMNVNSMEANLNIHGDQKKTEDFGSENYITHNNYGQNQAADSNLMQEYKASTTDLNQTYGAQGENTYYANENPYTADNINYEENIQDDNIGDEDKLADLEIRKILNSLDIKVWSEFVNKIKSLVGPISSNTISIVEKLITIFDQAYEDNDMIDECLGHEVISEMQQNMLDDTNAYKLLVEQVDLYSVAEDKLRKILTSLSWSCEIDDSQELKLRHIISRGEERDQIENIITDLECLETLPKNKLFSGLSVGINFVQEKVAKSYEIKTLLEDFWNKSTFEKINNAIYKKNTKFIEEINEAYLTLLKLYAMSPLKDQKIESTFWEIETIVKCMCILVGVKKIKFELFMKIVENVEAIENIPLNNTVFMEEICNVKGICNSLIEQSKRVAAGVQVDVKDMSKKFNEYESNYANIMLKDKEIEIIKSALGQMKNLIRKSEKVMFLTELKELRDKLLSAPIRDEFEISRLDSKIFEGESFMKTLKSISGEELSNQFPILEEAYQVLGIKINKFEEYLQIKQREQYFVNNIENILNEEGCDSSKIKELRVKLSKFKLCRFVEVDQFLVNKQVSRFRKAYENFSQGKDDAQTREEYLTSQNMNKGKLSCFEDELRALKERIRMEITMQKNKKSYRLLNCKMLQRECLTQGKNLRFTRKFCDRPVLASGKTSIFEKNLETFLENYRKKMIQKNRRKSSCTNKSDLMGTKRNTSIEKDETMRKNFLTELRKFFDAAEFLKINPADVPFQARRVESAIHTRMIDKSKYEKTMTRVLKFFKTIKSCNLYHLGRYIKLNDFKPKIIGKLSNKNLDQLKKLENSLGSHAESVKKNEITKKFFKPFEESNKNFNAKIKKVGRSGMNLGLGAQSHRDIISDSDEQKDLLNKRSVDSSIDYEVNDFGGFHYFNIFKGNFRMDLPESKQNCQTSLFTCAGQDFIKYFTEIPDNLHLVTKVDKENFQWYLNKALLVKQKKYLVLPGFVNTSSDLALKSEMINRNFVLSMSYSSKCKIFLCPKKFIQKDWLDILNIIVVRQEDVVIELFFFIVMKLNDDDYEPKMAPMKTGLINGKKPFILKTHMNDIIEQAMVSRNGELQVADEQIKQKQGSFGQEFYKKAHGLNNNKTLYGKNEDLLSQLGDFNGKNNKKLKVDKRNPNKQQKSKYNLDNTSVLSKDSYKIVNKKSVKNDIDQLSGVNINRNLIQSINPLTNPNKNDFRNTKKNNAIDGLMELSKVQLKTYKSKEANTNKDKSRINKLLNVTKDAKKFNQDDPEEYNSYYQQYDTTNNYGYNDIDSSQNMQDENTMGQNVHDEIIEDEMIQNDMNLDDDLNEFSDSDDADNMLNVNEETFEEYGQPNIKKRHRKLKYQNEMSKSQIYMNTEFNIASNPNIYNDQMAMNNNLQLEQQNLIINQQNPNLMQSQYMYANNPDYEYANMENEEEDQEVVLNQNYNLESVQANANYDGVDNSFLFKDRTNNQQTSFEDLFNSKAFQKLDFTDRKEYEQGNQYN